MKEKKKAEKKYDQKANGTTTGGAVNVTSDSIGRRLSGKDGHFAENGSRNL